MTNHIADTRNVPGRRLPICLGLAIVLLLSLAAESFAQFQQPRVFRGGIMMRNRVRTPARPIEPTEGPSASLEIDPEVERLLRRAQQYVEEKRFDLATVLAQKVLDGPASVMPAPQSKRHADRNLQTFTSTHSAVEQLLADLPAAALADYRLTADAEAQGLLATTAESEREAALAAVNRRYFISSAGDDAAFELGCRLMDRHDFVSASRLFSRILADHPDPSMPLDQILVRLAVASGRLGDREAASEAIELINKQRRPSISAETLALVERDLSAVGHAQKHLGGPASQWPMPHGLASGGGHMRGFADPNLLGPLVADAAWKTKEFPLPSVEASGMNPRNSLQGNVGILPVAGDAGSRQAMIKRWTAGRWFPVHQALVRGGRIYAKHYTQEGLGSERKPSEQVICYDAASGELVFRSQAAPAQLDMTPLMLMRMGQSPLNASQPFLLEEVLAFGDRTNHATALLGDRIVAVMGSSAGSDLEDPNMMRGFPQIAKVQNRLTAFSDPTEGKLLWLDAGNPWMNNIRFVSSPVQCGEVIVVAGREGAALYLFALSPTDGSLVWKTYLCDEPRGGYSTWSPVGVAAEGDEVYVASGCGVVFALDGVAGSIRWAVQYPPELTAPLAMQNANMVRLTATPVNGWDEDVVIAHGRALVVLPSDSPQILAFDRRTGELLWDSPKDTPDGGRARYALGVVGDGLYVAGNDVVRRIKLTGGAMTWEYSVKNSLGRGIVTSNAVYVPDGDSILHLDLERGKKISQQLVTLPDNDPVGNLLCDGQRFFVFGPDRLHALDWARSDDASEDGEPSAEEPSSSESTEEVAAPDSEEVPESEGSDAASEPTVDEAEDGLTPFGGGPQPMERGSP